MTLNITLATPWYIIQASDRRMISVPEGKPEDDEANKCIVLETNDGVFVITFAGVGKWGSGKNRIDIWLVEQMLGQGVPELHVEEGLKVIAKASTQLFNGFPKKGMNRHTFVIAGFKFLDNKPRPSIWTVSNYLTKEDIILESASDIFDIQGHPLTGKHALLFITGLQEAVSREDRKRLQKTLRIGATPEKLEKTIVDIMKTAARKPKWAWGINDNILAVRLNPNRQVLATHYPPSGHSSQYAPFFVWYEAGRDYAAGDAEVVSAGRGWRFGPLMYVIPPSSYGLQPKVDFSLRFENAKHKKDPLGDVSLIQEIQIS